MGNVIKIGISKKKRDKMLNLNLIEVIKGKGIVDDRYFKENNNELCQITLIEIENINHFNNISNSNIDAIDFRRNIITKGVELNKLLNKDFYVGEVKLSNEKI